MDFKKSPPSQQVIEEKPAKAEEKPAAEKAPKTKKVCLMSHATFGHHLAGYHLPRGKAVLVEIPISEFDPDSQRPTPESPVGAALAIYPGLLEFIEETDDRYTGRKGTETTKPIAMADDAKKVETVRVCAFSRHANGHYAGRVFWAGDSQAPLFYDVPRSALRALENDPNLSVISPTKPDEDGQRKTFEPPGAIAGADYFQALTERQKSNEEKESVYEEVKREKAAAAKHRRHGASSL